MMGDEGLKQLGEELDQGPAFDVDALFAATAQRIERQQSSPWRRMQSHPTWMRRAIVLAALSVIVVVAGPMSPRGDIDTYPLSRLLLHSVALLGLGGLCIWTALRPMHVPAWSRAKIWGATSFAVICTLVLLSLPEVPSTVEGSAFACFFFGVALALPVFLLVRVLDRGTTLSAVLAGAAAGLGGNVALQLHCPVNTHAHLLGGHFTVLLVFVTVGAGFALAIRKSKP